MALRANGLDRAPAMPARIEALAFHLARWHDAMADELNALTDQSGNPFQEQT